MGYVACTGTLDSSALFLGTLLYAWQFPHFNALSYNLRNDYAKAGYRMMCVVDPHKNALVSLRYALLMFPLSAACVLYITTPYFMIGSSIVNAYMAYEAYGFYRAQSRSTARRLFFSSLVHLPLLLALLVLHKKVEEYEESGTDTDL
jgi:heme o synthase